MTSNASSVPPIIQVGTDDAVWEWHTPSDCLFLSQGAVRVLQLDADIPLSMSAFLDHCSKDKRTLLRQSLRTFLDGDIGGHLELVFPVGDILARTQIMAVARDKPGRIERVLGCISSLERAGSVQSPFASARFSSSQKSSPQVLPSQDRARLLLALNASGDGLWDWDAANNKVYYSPRYIEMLGYTRKTFPSCIESWEEKIHPEDYENVVPMQKGIIASPANGDSFECTYRMRRADGTWAWILGRGQVTQRNAEGRATRVVGLHTDISASQEDRAHLEDLVRNDPLTGLRSRMYFSMMAERLEMTKSRPVSVIATDINGMKIINDHLGHAEGNAVLCQAALLLRAGVDSRACVARMSGDEYAVLLPGCDLNQAYDTMNKLSRRFEEHNSAADRIPILVAMGTACAKTEQTSIPQAITEADNAMLRQKFATRNETHQRIKNWIEGHTSIHVTLDNCRYL